MASEVKLTVPDKDRKTILDLNFDWENMSINSGKDMPRHPKFAYVYKRSVIGWIFIMI